MHLKELARIIGESLLPTFILPLIFPVGENLLCGGI